jgi:hypothetical protein
MILNHETTEYPLVLYSIFPYDVFDSSPCIRYTVIFSPIVVNNNRFVELNYATSDMIITMEISEAKHETKTERQVIYRHNSPLLL